MRRWAWLLLLALATTSVAQEISADDDAELRYVPTYLPRATAAADAPVTRHAWPFEPLSIGHTMASYQRYGWGAYFHHGLDIRGDAGTPVRAAAGGTVVNVGNYNGGSRLYWEVAILDDDGFLWQYHHVDHETIPQDVKDAFAQGGAVAAGTVLGEIVDWPMDSFGEAYHHVHLNVLAADGVYRNPFDFLDPLGDVQAPELRGIGLLDARGRVVDGTVARGDYSLYAEVADLIRHEAYIVPPHSIEVAVDGGAPEVVWTFDRLPGGASRTAFVDDFFAHGTCGNYSCRRIRIDLGFSPGEDRTFPGAPGAHRVEVTIRDHAGNSSRGSFAWTVPSRVDG